MGDSEPPSSGLLTSQPIPNQPVANQHSPKLFEKQPQHTMPHDTNKDPPAHDEHRQQSAPR